MRIRILGVFSYRHVSILELYLFCRISSYEREEWMINLIRQLPKMNSLGPITSWLFSIVVSYTSDT
jgi:hypothetical protein